MSNKSVQGTLAAIALASAGLVTPAIAQIDPTGGFTDTPTAQVPVQTAPQQVQPGYAQGYGAPQGYNEVSIFTVDRYLPVHGDSVGMAWDSASDCLVRNRGQYVYVRRDFNGLKANNWYTIDVPRESCAIANGRIDESIFKGLGYKNPETLDYLQHQFQSDRHARSEGMRQAEYVLRQVGGAFQITADTVMTANPDDPALNQNGPCTKIRNGKVVYEQQCVVSRGRSSGFRGYTPN